MKIVRQTPEQLIMRQIPWIIALGLCVFLLAIVASGLNDLVNGTRDGIIWKLLLIPAFLSLFFAIFVRRDDVILDRSRDLLELRHSTVFGRTKVQHKLRHLDRAIVQSSRTSKGGMTYRPALVLTAGMDAGTHPVTPVYVSGFGAERTVTAINEWLSQNVDSAGSQA